MQTLSVEKKPDAISAALSKMYDTAIDHAIEAVKTEMIFTTDINTLMVMSNFKNSLIAKLLSIKDHD